MGGWSWTQLHHEGGGRVDTAAPRERWEGGVGHSCTMRKVRGWTQLHHEEGERLDESERSVIRGNHCDVYRQARWGKGITLGVIPQGRVGAVILSSGRWPHSRPRHHSPRAVRVGYSRCVICQDVEVSVGKKQRRVSLT